MSKYYILLAFVCFSGLPNRALAIAYKPQFVAADPIKVGGEGGWDYLLADSVTHKLYVARASRVQVFDLDKATLLGELTPVDGAHGMTLVPAVNSVFVTAGKAGKVMVFDMTTMKPKGEIPVGGNPDAIILESQSGEVFAFNGTSHDVSVIDPKKMQVTKVIKLDGKPEFAATKDDGNVYVNIEDKNELSVIDTDKKEVTQTFSLKPCEEPTGLSANPHTHHLMVGCGNSKAFMLDAKTGKILKEFSVGAKVDATVFDRDRDLFFVSAGEGKMTVIHDTNAGGEITQEIATKPGARTMAFDSRAGKAYLAAAEFETAKGQDPHARPAVKAGTFEILVFALGSRFDK